MRARVVSDYVYHSVSSELGALLGGADADLSESERTNERTNQQPLKKER